MYRVATKSISNNFFIFLRIYLVYEIREIKVLQTVRIIHIARTILWKYIYLC
jgi:hypothetical protein